MSVQQVPKGIADYVACYYNRLPEDVRRTAYVEATDYYVYITSLAASLATPRPYNVTPNISFTAALRRVSGLRDVTRLSRFARLANIWYRGYYGLGKLVEVFIYMTYSEARSPGKKDVFTVRIIFPAPLWLRSEYIDLLKTNDQDALRALAREAIENAFFMGTELGSPLIELVPETVSLEHHITYYSVPRDMCQRYIKASGPPSRDPILNAVLSVLSPGTNPASVDSVEERLVETVGEALGLDLSIERERAQAQEVAADLLDNLSYLHLSLGYRELPPIFASLLVSTNTEWLKNFTGASIVTYYYYRALRESLLGYIERLEPFRGLIERFASLISNDVYLYPRHCPERISRVCEPYVAMDVISKNYSLVPVPNTGIRFNYYTWCNASPKWPLIGPSLVIVERARFTDSTLYTKGLPLKESGARYMREVIEEMFAYNEAFGMFTESVKDTLEKIEEGAREVAARELPLFPDVYAVVAPICWSWWDLAKRLQVRWPVK